MTAPDNHPPAPDAELRSRLIHGGKLYELASLVGTDAKTPFTNLVDYIEQLIGDEERRLLERLKAHKQPWFPNRDTGKLEECIPLDNVNKELERLDALAGGGAHDNT